jgi:predicted ATPase/class 3 adenylate cyclase
VRKCIRCETKNPDSARFCLACGSALTADGRPPYERKVVTVVFIDIVASSATGEPVDPEDVAARLIPYYEQVRSQLERHGGTVEKFIGDAVVAIFGAPVVHEDDAERAVRAALAAFDAIAALNASDAWLDLKIRVGINTGEALVDLGAHSATGEGIASGDVINTAARLQAAAPVNGILVGALTHEATSDLVDYRDAGTIEAKGKSEPVRVWEVIGLRRRERAEGTAPPFVGRDADLRQLADLWNTVRASRRPAIAAVVGSPGLGKTRLLTEFADSLASDAAVLWGRCLPYGEGITYWPVTEIAERAAGVLKSDSAAAAAAKISAFADRLEARKRDERSAIAAALSSVIGVPATEATPAELSRAELHWGLRRMLQLLSFERPLLILVDDLHWAEPVMLDLLGYLAEAEEAAYLVIGSFRADASDSVHSFTADASLSLRLEPLTAEASRAFLTELVGAADAATATATAVLNRASGNPLFLEETVRMLRERGRRWETGDGPGETLPMPTSLQALIGSRIDRLPEVDKRTAQYASVVGEVFWPGAVAHLLGDNTNADALNERLANLEHRDFVRRTPESTVEGETEYAFKHILIRDVAYAQLPRATRGQLHVRFAKWVQSLGNQELIEITAWHLEQACKLARDAAAPFAEAPVTEAVAALCLAGEKATRRQGWREAERFLSRALELVDTDGEAALEVRIRYAGALIGVGQVKKAIAFATPAREDALSAGRLDLAAETLITLCHVAHRQGDAIGARNRVDELRAITSRLRDRRLDLRARFMSASITADMEGEPKTAADELMRGIAIAEELGDRPLSLDGHLRLGFVFLNMGELASAEDELKICSALAEELGNNRDLVRATCPLATIRYLRGDVEGAEELAEQTATLLERTGETFFQIQNLMTLAQGALARGDAAGAEGHLRSALLIALDEDSVFVADICRLLIEALIDLGHLDEAADIAAFAERRIQQSDRYTRAAAQMGQAALAQATGDFPTAIRNHKAALAALEELTMPIDLAQARLAYGMTLRKAGEDEEAREQFELAQRACRQMGATGLLRRIEGELARLETHSA